jgi:A/G-specific adenine glycosylase
MLQQTRVQTVEGYWQRWMRALPDARAFAGADPAQTHKLWEGLGYYARVRNAQAAARVMVEKHGGEFPRTFAEALALPGVGRYTAGAVCSIAYNQPAAILDGNVMRVLSRIFGVPGDPRGKEANGRLWALAEDLVKIAAGGRRQAEDGNCGRLNQALMELGALVCAPREARCEECPVSGWCFARREGRVSEFPRLKAAGKLSRRRFAAFVVTKNGRFLARQRPAGGVNAHLWEFPNAEIAPGEENAAAAAGPFVLRETKAFWRVRHTITRHRILLEAYRAELPEPAGKGAVPGVWRTLAQLDGLAFTSAHRKLLAVLRDEIKCQPGPGTARCHGR